MKPTKSDDGEKATEISVTLYDKGDPDCPDLRTALDALRKLSAGIPDNYSQTSYNEIPHSIYVLAGVEKGSPILVVDITYADGKKTKSIAVEPNGHIVHDLCQPAVRDMHPGDG